MMIKWASEIMDANLEEAHKYARKAHELHDSCRASADWCMEMAKAHMQFNVSGRSVVERLMDNFSEDPANAQIAPGVLAVYNDKRADRVTRAAEIQAMMSMYK